MRVLRAPLAHPIEDELGLGVDAREADLETRGTRAARRVVRHDIALAAQDGHEPNVERCCAKILLRHGEKMTDGPFACPVCGTKWERRTERLHGLRVPVFAKAGLPEPLTVQPGRTRPFLVPVSVYSPPRE